MSKKKFSFDVTGREIFASERPIADALDAKYGGKEGVVAQKWSGRERTAVRSALRSGKPRETAFFGVVEEARKATTVEMKVLKVHGAKVVVVQPFTATSGAPKTAAKAGSVKAAAAKTGSAAKAEVGKTVRIVRVATPKAVAQKAPAKKATTKVTAAKRPAAAVKSAVRRTRSNPTISKTV
jgi:DNA-binding protein HU-beta